MNTFQIDDKNESRSAGLCDVDTLRRKDISSPVPHASSLESIFIGKKAPETVSLYKKIFWGGAALCCAASLLTACSHLSGQGALPAAMGKTVSTVFSADFSDAATLQAAILPVGQTASTAPSSESEDPASIQILSYDGMLGNYSFRECNETQLFGDYTLSLVSFGEEEYLMLSRDQIALLAKEDGSDAKLIYQGQCLSLPFSCPFYVGCNLLELYEGDFLGNGGRQLALIIPVEDGSGIYIQKLGVINLDATAPVSLYSDDSSCQAYISSQFASHFSARKMNVTYHVYDYIHYAIYGNQILVTYGASDESGNYLSFFSSTLTAKDGKLELGDLHFWDNFY